MNWSAGTEYKGEVSPVLSWSRLVKGILSLKALVNKKDVIFIAAHISFALKGSF